MALRLRQETGAPVKWIAEQLGMGGLETMRSRPSEAATGKRRPNQPDRP